MVVATPMMRLLLSAAFLSLLLGGAQGKNPQSHSREVVDMDMQTAKGVPGKYTGTVNSRGKAHGWGTFTFLDGHVYEGDFQNGVRHGQGTYEHWNGDVYEGDFENDKRHGVGTVKYEDGDLFEGDFMEDKIHGFGTYKFADGNEYEGDFQNDKKCVRGGVGWGWVGRGGI